MSEPNLSSTFSYGAGEPAASSASADAGPVADSGADSGAPAETQSEESPKEQAGVPAAKADNGGAGRSAADGSPAAADKGGEDVDAIEKATNLDELKAALRGRSPSRAQREAIDTALSRMPTLEQELARLRSENETLRKPAAPAKPEPTEADKKKADDAAYLDWLNRGPAAMEELVDRKLKARDEAREQRRLEGARNTANTQEVEFVKKNPTAIPTLKHFAELAKRDPALRAQAIRIAKGEDPDHKDVAQWCFDYASAAMEFEKYPSLAAYNEAQRAKWVAEEKTKSEGGGAGQQQGAAGAPPAQRRTPLTLVNSGGGGGDMIPQSSDTPNLSKSFSY